MQLSGIDLNQLVVLDALLQARSVKGAARRVGLSPSATSHALARLRDLFDDDLLVRAGRGMVLTARAETLQPEVRSALAAVEGVFHAAEPVDPAELTRRFVVATTDYADLMLLAPVGAQLTATAPGVDLYCRRGAAPIELLRAGDADLAVVVLRGSPPPDLIARPLLEERFVCLLRRGHPALEGGGLTLDRYCDLDHVLVTPRADGRGIVDRFLEARDRQRRVARTVEGFLVAPHLIVGTDLVITLASRLARRYADLLDLAVVEPPLPLPTFTVSLVWHRRSARDRGLTWLRDELTAHAATLAGEETTEL